MSTESNELKFTFAWQALELLGQSLYTNPWNAIAELVANGFDAGAETVYVLIDARDKKHAHIEIMDNGSGMSQEDLSIYVKVGHDRRLDPRQNSRVDSNFVMGRKGIGKLAALYLSSSFKLATKVLSGNQEVWSLEKPQNLDEEPVLKRSSLANGEIENAFWWSTSSGTLLILDNVDLSGFGKRSFDGLSHKLADQFMLTALPSKSIQICVLDSATSSKTFHEVEKAVAFNNLAEIAINLSKDQIPLDVLQTMQNGRKVTIPYGDKSLTGCFEYETRVLSLSELEDKESKIEGLYRVSRDSIAHPDLLESRSDIEFDGDDVLIPYVLTGWIGFHATIDNKIARKNDERFEKNKFYNPAKIRLYVRNKLASDSLLNSLGFTAAFANYIEGEVTFDLLDDDLLPDIATSNRQGFNELDDRWELLIRTMRPLVRELINKRNAMVEQRKKEEKTIKEDRASRAKCNAIKQFNNEIDSLDLNQETKDHVSATQASLLEGDIELLAKENYLIFLSHQGEDKQFADFIYYLLKKQGARPEEFFYTSCDDYGACPQGNDPLDQQIKRNIVSDNTLLAYITSANFRGSENCLFEAGAGWATRTVGEYHILSTRYEDIPDWLTNRKRESCVSVSGEIELTAQKYNYLVALLNTLIAHLNCGRDIKEEELIQEFETSVFPDKKELEESGANIIDYMNQDIVSYWNVYMAPFLKDYFKNNFANDSFSGEDGLSA